MIKEFKEFINRGNVFDAAVGLIMALAFTPVVQSLVDDIIMQIIAAVVGQPDFSELTLSIGDAEVRYGNFITAVTSFLIIAFVVFLMVKAYNNMMKKDEEEEDEGPSEKDILIDIRDQLAASNR